MSDIVEFLLARVAEDEADARAADGSRWIHQDKLVSFEALGPDGDWVDVSAPISVDTRANGHHIARWSPARVLAECEAKRRIVEEWRDCVRLHDRLVDDEDDMKWEYLFRSEALGMAVKRLAQPYADHLDFDPAWRI